MANVPHIKLDATKPAVWAALAYAAIRGGDNPTVDRTAALKEWGEKAGLLANLEYEPDIVEDEMEDLLYDSLEKHPDGFYLSAGDSAIFIHPAILRGLQ